METLMTRIYMIILRAIKKRNTDDTDLYDYV